MSGFGRRILQSGTRELTLVSNSAEPQELRADLIGRDDLKEKIRSILMTKIDPAVAGKMPRLQLRAEVALLVTAIATE